MKVPFEDRLGWYVARLIGHCGEELQRLDRSPAFCADEIGGMLRAVSLVIPQDKLDLYRSTEYEVFAYLRGLVPAEGAETFFYLKESTLEGMRSTSHSANDAARRAQG